MKQQDDLAPADFERHPVWIGVHNYDSDEPWYEQSDEQTFRPWTEPLPFAEVRGIALVAATFELADGSIYSGYCQAVREDWDLPRPPARSWSAMHGGTKLSLLALLNPTIFFDRRPFNFHLGIPERRKNRIRQFYAAVGKKLADVFPLRFAANNGLATGIASGKLEGFFYFPMGREPFEISTGESLLEEERPSQTPLEENESLKGPRRWENIVCSEQSGITPESVPLELKPGRNLSLADFERHPVWGLAEVDESKPMRQRFMFRPWTGSLPVDPEKGYVLILATFVLHDGGEYRGYIRAIPENWIDIVPPPRVLPKGMIITQKSPRVRFAGSPLAVIGEQRPCIFIAGQRFEFWCGVKDVDDLRLPFYDALKKPPEAIFPIAFRGEPGLATGIVSGELNGFYEITFGGSKPPKVTL